MVIAFIALLVALGGTSYAVVRLPANSVGSKQIKRGAVKSSDLGSNAVSSGKVRNGSLLATDFAAGQLPSGPAGPAGPAGPTGATGATGATGLQGPPGPTTAAVGTGQTPDPLSIKFGNTTLTTPTAGDVLVHGHFTETAISCNAVGTCTLQVGVFLDGAPVPNGGRSISAAASSTKLFDGTVSGIVPDVPAGDHTLQLGFQPSGNWASAGGGAAQVVGIALGG